MIFTIKKEIYILDWYVTITDQHAKSSVTSCAGYLVKQFIKIRKAFKSAFVISWSILKFGYQKRIKDEDIHVGIMSYVLYIK